MLKSHFRAFGRNAPLSGLNPLFSAVLSIHTVARRATGLVVGVAAIFGADDFGKIQPGAVAPGAGLIGVAIWVFRNLT
jgi:hypothetical protein